jgi:two-component sensor histidine kinase
MNQNQKMLLTEKEWLLREIHHRVKNNLQTTMSLLKMQSAYINNESALEAMRNSQRRMFAMSLIHQKLYQSDEMTHINIKDYIYELVYYLKDSYSSKIKGSFSDRNKITYELNVATIDLDIVQAIPLGLIINEAVTNAIKYAFPNEMNGVITILLKQTHDDYFLLNISDNGVGLPADFDLNSTNSLGMNLMRGLCDQLQGEFSLERYFGTGLKFTFKRVDKIIREDQLSYNKTEIS